MPRQWKARRGWSMATQSKSKIRRLDCGVSTLRNWRNAVPKTACGLDASHALAKQIGRKRLICTRRDTDRYGRMVARCTVEGVDISQWMVTQGQAIAFRKYSLDYIADEDRARAAKAGIWAGEFQDPSDFRHQKRGGQGSAPRERAASEGQARARRACACPDDTDNAGHRCGGRSSNLRLGGRTSACVARK